jgi:hypothetical protein
MPINGFGLEWPRLTSHGRPDGSTEFAMEYRDRRVVGVIVPDGPGATITFERRLGSGPAEPGSIRVADEHGAMDVLRDLFAWIMTGRRP